MKLQFATKTVCMSITLLMLVSSCKKELSNPPDIGNQNKESTVNNLTTSPVKNQNSIFYNYIKTLSSEKALDTLKKFIETQKVANNINVKNFQLKSVNSINTLSEEPTPEQLEQYTSVPSIQDLYMNLSIYPVDYTWTEVKIVQWRIFTGYHEWWKVDSREEVELTHDGRMGMGPNYNPVYISNFQHSGSFYTNDFPLLIMNWNESLNEHAPLTLGPGTQMVASHVIGQLSVYGVSLYGDNFAAIRANYN